MQNIVKQVKPIKKNKVETHRIYIKAKIQHHPIPVSLKNSNTVGKKNFEQIFILPNYKNYLNQLKILMKFYQPLLKPIIKIKIYQVILINLIDIAS
jgi:hypothetical protein